ncbi:MAG: hypothetical protein IKA85_07220 [Clostridia bacterium]|nr:hypothetical protein [Clostridia bacterium]
MKSKIVKYYVCLPVVLVCLFLLLLSIGSIFLIYLVNGEEELEKVSFSLLLFPIIPPSVLFLWVFIAYSPKITFSDIGIKKHWCGILLKKYLWKDVQDIKIIETAFGTSWLFFSKKDLKKHRIDYCRLHPQTIYIAVDDNKLEKIKEFVPEDKKIRIQK